MAVVAKPIFFSFLLRPKPLDFLFFAIALLLPRFRRSARKPASYPNMQESCVLGDLGLAALFAAFKNIL
jgi:hypothetical protein